MASASPASTPYELLGVAVTATPAEITSAYRKAARRLHPDINPGADPGALAAVSDAYAVLSRPTSRAQYDSGTRTADVPGRPAAAGPVTETRQEGLDVTTRVTLGHRAARDGAEVHVDVTYDQPCRDCAASGFDAARLDRTCPVCAGVRMHPVTGKTCEYCAGAGRISDHPCPTCAGARTTPTTATLTVPVPPGTTDGTRIRLSRKGPAAADGRSRGNVYVEVRLDPAAPDAAPPTCTVTPDAATPDSGAPAAEAVRAGRAAEEFQVAANGADVGLVAYLDYPELRLGGTVVVADPTGRTHPVRVPPGSRPGDVIRVPGAGHHGRDGRPADLHVQVALRFPEGPPDAAERAALSDVQNSQTGRGWTLEEARRHTVVERLLERCATYATDARPCPDRADLPRDDWCERCLAATRLSELGEHQVQAEPGEH